MSDSHDPHVPAGWYPDGSGGERWWDGTRWTDDVRPAVAPPPPGGELPGPQSPGGANTRLMAVVVGVSTFAVLALVLVVVLAKTVGGGGPGAVVKEYLTSTGSDLIKRCELLSEGVQRDMFADYSVGDDIVEGCQDWAYTVEEGIDDEGYWIGDCDMNAQLESDLRYEVTIHDVEEQHSEALVSYESSIRFVGDLYEYRDCDEFVVDDYEWSGYDQALVCKEYGEWKIRTERYTGDERCYEYSTDGYFSGADD